MITLLALPTIWLANRSGDAPGARPNVAAVGLDPGESDRSAPASSRDAFDPMGPSGAAYLQPVVTATPPTAPTIAIGTHELELVASAKATYSSQVPWNECRINSVPIGQTVTVVNVANGRSFTCRTAYLSGGETGVLVMYTSRYQSIADLATASIHVEIHR